MERQLTNHIFMIRPSSFGYNAETAENNSFQSNEGDLSRAEIAQRAKAEFDGAVEILRSAGIDVEVFEDLPNVKTLDSVFPNNWITTHSDGLVISYPLWAENRRPERRPDLIHQLGLKYAIDRDYTFEHYEEEGHFLEGTGSMILDREHKVMYAAISERTHVNLLDKWAVLMGYQKIHFHATDRNNENIYHTNVMMSVGDRFAIICLDSIRDETERAMVVLSLKRTKKDIIEITYDQMESFAGNMIQLASTSGKSVLVMSEAARNSLREDQIRQMELYANIVAIPIPTIEQYGGGSIRCMIAEIFLPKIEN